MKKIFLLFVLSLNVFFASAQTKIYKENSSSYSDCLLTVEGKRVYRGNSTSYSDCIATVDGIVKYFLVAVLVGPY
ncbi:MAG: hypothetical protein ACKOA7_04635 [Bacteroidota bacterium]